ncbi:nitroreductase/quinone reductase family protein [Nocardiopsis rhodophaea]|uniref:nitroreductase/quinone reductase family protein n=1 Tax=Nocardiopsis rhodophaea TaxID=280238 RepID=UPI0031D329AD
MPIYGTPPPCACIRKYRSACIHARNRRESITTEFHQQVIDEFRANRGRVGGLFEGARLILLTTFGAKSRLRRTTPLGYLPDGGTGHKIVIASAGGAPRHPAWYHNILADPRVTVEDGVFTYTAEARVLRGAERDRMFARAVEADPGWGEYQVRADRLLPVIALEPREGSPPDLPTGDGLKAIHDAFRRELSLVRAEFAASGPGSLGAQLRVNCLTVCQGLDHHHAMEDGGMLPELRAQHPELAPVLDRLSAEHKELERLLQDLQFLISDVSGRDVDTEQALADVDSLIAAVEAHLDYEEEQLIPLLNGVIA